MKESESLWQPSPKTYNISLLRGGDGSVTALSDGAQDLLMVKNRRASSSWPKNLHDKSAERGDGPAKALLTGAQDLLIHVRMRKTYGNTYKSDIADRHQKPYWDLLVINLL